MTLPIHSSEHALGSRIGELSRIFATTRDKREAHRKAGAVMFELSQDPGFLTAVLHKHLATPGALGRKNYPVVSMNIELNPHYELVANCWIPLPGRETDISTKAIHHHGEMLLTTVTGFGPGYEHWLFTRPKVVDPAQELYELGLVERGPHPLHHVAFVDAHLPHLPLYPPSLTITFALWSNSKPTTWKDRVKRIPVLKRNEQLLRRVAVRSGLAKSLDVKVVHYFDFYPTEQGFRGIKDRKEFERGPNADYLHSLFHVIQGTGNDRLAPVVREQVESGAGGDVDPICGRLLDDLEAGRPIEGQLSEGHYGIPFANFTKHDIEQSLEAQRQQRGALVGR